MKPRSGLQARGDTDKIYPGHKEVTTHAANQGEHLIATALSMKRRNYLHIVRICWTISPSRQWACLPNVFTLIKGILVRALCTCFSQESHQGARTFLLYLFGGLLLEVPCQYTSHSGQKQSAMWVVSWRVPFAGIALRRISTL